MNFNWFSVFALFCDFGLQRLFSRPSRCLIARFWAFSAILPPPETGCFRVSWMDFELPSAFSQRQKVFDLLPLRRRSLYPSELQGHGRTLTYYNGKRGPRQQAICRKRRAPGAAKTGRRAKKQAPPLFVEIFQTERFDLAHMHKIKNESFPCKNRLFLS